MKFDQTKGPCPAGHFWESSSVVVQLPSGATPIAHKPAILRERVPRSPSLGRKLALSGILGTPYGYPHISTHGERNLYSNHMIVNCLQAPTYRVFRPETGTSTDSEFHCDTQHDRSSGRLREGRLMIKNALGLPYKAALSPSEGRGVTQNISRTLEIIHPPCCAYSKHGILRTPWRSS
jgi:hypothetical protein